VEEPVAAAGGAAVDITPSPVGGAGVVCEAEEGVSPMDRPSPEATAPAALRCSVQSTDVPEITEQQDDGAAIGVIFLDNVLQRSLSEMVIKELRAGS